MCIRDRHDSDDKTVGQSQGNGTNYRYNNTRLLWETHIEFKAFREIIFLTYTDEYNVEITDIVDKDFVIPDNATTTKFINKYGNKSKRYDWVDSLTGVAHSAERLWIPRRYEVTRLGQDVYVNYREVPNQPINIDNPYRDFELSYKGRVFTNNNSDSISLVQRATPLVFQYMVVKMIMNRELSKYQGYVTDIDIDQVPDYLELDKDGEHNGKDKLAVWRLYMKKLGLNIYSGSQSADGRPPATRSPGSRSSMTGNATELIALSQLLDYIDREIGMAMGISPQREASFSQGSNVADNRQAITQSHHITEPYFFMHSQVWKSALNEWLRMFRLYCKQIFESTPGKKEHFIEYIMPNGAKELLRVTPEILDHEDIGIFLSNSGQDQFYRDTMIQLVHAFGQNAGEGMEVVSSMVKAISNGDSPEEIHKMIGLEASRQQERQAQIEEMQSKRAQENEQRQTEWREDEQAHDLDMIDRKGEWDMKEAAIDVYKHQDDLNQDQDGIPDPIEAAMAMHQIQKENIELGQKNKELAIAEKKNADDAALKREEIAVKKKQASKPTTPSK